MPAARTRRLALVVLAAALAAGCAGGPVPLPDLGGLYNQAAQAGDDFRNPVIVIPGILGSRLQDRETGRVVWGAFLGTYADPRTPDGARLIALPMAAGRPLGDLRDAVEPAGALDRLRVSLLGLPVEQHAYLYVLRALGVGGYRDQDLGRGGLDYGSRHFTCFQFAYDWRRDNAENARRLHEFILDRRAYVAAELKRRHGIDRPDVRFDLVAHSMGGLLARYYLRYGPAPLPGDGTLPPLTWEGARHVDRAVLIATPNGGAAQSLIELVQGTRLAFVLPRYAPAVVGTMPALYQLLPRARHGAVVEAAGPGQPGRPLDVLDPAVWARLGWGLAAPDQEPVLRWLLPDVPDAAARRRIALDHLGKALARARQFHAALDAPAVPPPGLGLHLFAGDARPTPAVLEANPATGQLAVRATAPGDGTVLRTSAVMDERVGRAWTPGLVSPIGWTDVTFLFSDHLALTRDPAFTDNVLFRLLEGSGARASALRRGAPAAMK
jgi:hypothetical protein